MKNKLFKKLLFLIVVMSGNVFFGQTIKGKVFSSGMPLPGVGIMIKGSTVGTISDFDGSFVLKNVTANSTIVFSYVGYASQEIVAIDKPMSVNLIEDSKLLNEVVVVGYGSVKKKDVTSAVATLSMKSIKDQPFVGIDQAMQGKVSGVTVTQNSGTPGGGVSVRIRGITSLSGNEPLYVVDGVPIDGNDNNSSFNFSNLGGGSGQTKVSAISSINPNDVESVDILKDASAAAIYGSRASNGVVIITTKKGKAGKSVIAYDGYTGFQQVTKLLPVMDLKDYSKYIGQVYPQSGLTVPYELQNPDLLGSGTNWQKEIFRDAPISSHQLSLSGGKDNTKYYTSINYFDQDGIVINSDFKRYSMRLNVESKLKEWFTFGNTLAFTNSTEHITLNDDESGVISSAIRQSPMIPVRYSDGSWGGPTTGFGVGNGRNPVAYSEIRNNELVRYKINGNLFGDFKIIKGLNFRSELGYDYSTSRNSIFDPTYKIGNVENTVATSIKANSESFYWLFKNYLTYKKDFGKHSITALLGQEAQQSTYQGVSASRRGFVSNEVPALSVGDPTTATNDSYQGTSSISSLYTRLNYSFDDRYLLTGSLRSDSSSKFGANYKTGYFPAVSGAWVVSNETFMSGAKNVVNFLKFRAGYGEVGNQNIVNYAYGAAISSFATPFGTGFAQSNIQNPNVKWEATKSLNIGTEIGFLNDIIRLDVDVYKKISSDFLYSKPSPGVIGSYPSAPYLGLAPPLVNLGEIENKGIDLTLNTRNFATKDFTWNSTVVYSTYKNKLTSFADDNSAIYRTFEYNNTLTKTAVGQPIGQFYGFVVEGLYKDEADLMSSPTPQYAINKDTGVWVGDVKYKDVNNDGKIDDNDRTYIGNPNPKFVWSFSNNLTYKRFDLAFSFMGSQGNDIYNWTRVLSEGMKEINGNQSQTVNDRFIEGVNENTTIPRFVNGDPNKNSRVSDRFIEDGSYIRLQNVTLGFSVDPKFLDNSKLFTKLRVYASGQNLFTWTKYSGLDPAVGSYSQDALLMGVDNGRYPVARSIMMGLNLEF
jgi:TonB-dependent starch-binding outer membrane protein SusC